MKKKLSPNEKDILETQKQNAIKRDLLFLRPLLIGINQENSKTFDELKRVLKNKKKDDLRWSVLIVSREECFRHFSVVALMSFFNRYTTYRVSGLDNLITTWFSGKDEAIETRDDLLEPEIVILFGKDSFQRDNARGTRKRTIVEISETRRAQNKITWIFCTEKDLEYIINNNSNENLEPYLDNIIDLDGSIKAYRKMMDLKMKEENHNE